VLLSRDQRPSCSQTGTLRQSYDVRIVSPGLLCGFVKLIVRKNGQMHLFCFDSELQRLSCFRLVSWIADCFAALWRLMNVFSLIY
jgi:hypothetical protein